MQLRKIAAVFVSTVLVAGAYAGGPDNMAPMPANDWAGYYAGVELGGGFGTTKYASTEAFGSVFYDLPALAYGSFTQNFGGVLGGVQLGHNWQHNRWVFGLETAFDGLDFSSTTSNSFAGPAIPSVHSPAFAVNVQTETTYNWLYSLTPRMGYAYHNFLFFGKLGLGITQAIAEISAPISAPGGVNIPASSFTQRQDLLGVDIGAGVDYELHRWILGAEYDYIYFGTTQVGYGNSNGIYGTSNIKTAFNAVKAKVAYKFNI